MQLTHTDIVECRNVLKSLLSKYDRYEISGTTEYKEYLTTLEGERHKFAEGMGVARFWSSSENIPERHAGFRIDQATHELWIATFNRVLSAIGGGSIFGLTGRRGSGKTQLGVEIVKTSCISGHPARYTSLVDFYIAIKSTYRRDAKKTEEAVIRDWVAPRVLVIDECHEKSDRPWESTMLTHLVNLRYGAMKDTLMIANVDLKKGGFEDVVGPSIASRMMECGGIIGCNWDSFRGAK